MHVCLQNVNVFEENIYQTGKCTIFNNLIVNFQIMGL